MTVELDGVDLVEDPASADVTLFGGPDEGWTYPRLNAVFRRLVEGRRGRDAAEPLAADGIDVPKLDAGLRRGTGVRDRRRG